jgi:hypothetical protein
MGFFNTNVVHFAESTRGIDSTLEAKMSFHKNHAPNKLYDS